ncbi:MAG: hypothetical protein K6A35_09255 [bacterium]|nr:hypothetical protein [bacterium]
MGSPPALRARLAESYLVVVGSWQAVALMALINGHHPPVAPDCPESEHD